jgi:adenosylhomocysteine nucleosidase
MSNLGFVTGLAAERRVLIRVARERSASEPRVACAGARTARAAELARRLAAQGVEGLVSFGVAGGLDPTLEPGRMLLPSRVMLDAAVAIETDPGLRRSLLELARSGGLSPVEAPLAGSDRAVASRAAKRALHEASGAAAVDMESHAVAEAAREAGLPFVAIRVVVDDAGCALPSAVLGAITPDGHSRGGLVAARLCLRPWEVASVRRLGEQMRRALAELERLTRATAPLLLGGP